MEKMDKNEAQYKKMTEEPVGGLILSLAVPTIISMIVTAIYNTADTYFVSQLGTSASGAVGIVMSLMALIQSIGFMTGMGAGSWMSRLLGQKKDQKASQVAASAFYFAFALGLLVAVFGRIFLDPLVGLLGATETIRPYAREYAQYILYAAPFLIASFTMNKMLCAEGKARFAMFGIAFGGILNIFLDPLFIFGLHLGIAGAAIATGLSQLVSFGILLYMFVSGRTIAKLGIRNAAQNAKMYVEIVQSGVPSFFRQGLASVASIALNKMAAGYGDAAVSAMAIVTKVFMLVFSVLIGFGQGYQPVAGYNYGAKKYGRVKESFSFMVCSATVFMAVFAVLGYLAAPQLIRFFISSDPDVVKIGTESLRFQCLSMPFLPLNICCNMTFQTIGRAGLATFLSTGRQGYAFLPLIVLLPHFIGLTGVEVAQPIADVISFAICVPYTIKFIRELNQVK
ncbi:MAG: MATE family efflux transporter [Lachnospiraceae bacterium]